MMRERSTPESIVVIVISLGRGIGLPFWLSIVQFSAIMRCGYVDVDPWWWYAKEIEVLRKQVIPSDKIAVSYT